MRAPFVFAHVIAPPRYHLDKVSCYMGKVWCQIPWPFFSRELCRKAPNVGADLKVGQWGFLQKTRENRRKLGVHRR